LQFMHPDDLMRGDDEGPLTFCTNCCATPISEEMVMVDEMLMVSAVYLDLAGAGR
jgi:hypothetical protein